MQHKFRNILSTRIVGEEFIQKAASAGIIVDELAFIQTEKITTASTSKKISDIIRRKTAVAFTSTNAVDAVAAFVEDHQPEWRIFCTGGATKELAMQKFPASSIIGTGKDADGLADIIIDSGDIRNIVFFCGEKRRDELPSKLTRHKIEIDEVMVYKTMLNEWNIDKPYDGILFFSPSAVDSFFLKNRPAGDAVLFTIGETTTAALKHYSTNQVITSTFPSKEKLLEIVIQYFNTINQNS